MTSNSETTLNIYTFKNSCNSSFKLPAQKVNKNGETLKNTCTFI